MRVFFADRGWEDFRYWVDHDQKIARRIVRQIEAIRREDEHKLVHTVEHNSILIAKAR